MRSASAVARQSLRDMRVKVLSFGVLGGIYALGQVAAYAHAYADPAVRASLAAGLADDAAIRMFYGMPYDLMTTGGYAAWRVGGVVVIAYAFWATVTSVAIMRGEEESGRAEIVLAGALTRSGRTLAILAALGAGAIVLWAALAAGLLIGGLPLGGSAYLALAVASVIPVFVGVGLWASVVAPTRRAASELASGAVMVALVMRVVADTIDGLAWLRWLSPFGWSELLRPFTGAAPWILLLPVFASALLIWTAALVAGERDLGAGIIAPRDRAPARLRLLGGVGQLAARELRRGLAAWAIGFAVYGLVIGAVSGAVETMEIPAAMREQMAKVGGASFVTASDYLSFVFLIFIVALGLFGASQVSAARREEADGRLEVLLALPAGRLGWLAGRACLAAGGLVLLAFVAALATWLGAAAGGTDVALAGLLEAAANALPAAALFLGVGLLAYATSPRIGAGATYGLVVGTFVWKLFGALLGAPTWTLGLSPFHHIGLVPAQPFKGTAAAAMLLLAMAAGGAGMAMFRRRDLVGT